MKLRIGKPCESCDVVTTNDMVKGGVLVCSGCGAVSRIPAEGSSLLLKVAGVASLLLAGAGLYVVAMEFASGPGSAYDFYGKSNRQAMVVIQQCRRQGVRSCVEDGFEYLVAQNPGNHTYQANYAFALTESEKFEEAERHYEELIDEGAATYDLFAWYARNRKGQGDEQGAIEWYENSLSVNPSTVDVTSELATAYTSQGRLWEAASLLDSYARNHPRGRGYVKGKLVLVQNRIADSDSGTVESITLKSTRNGHFAIPIHWGEEVEPEMYLVDTGATLLMMPTSDFEKIPDKAKEMLGTGQSRVADSRVVDINLARLDYLWFGPWKLRDVRAGYCDECSRLAGMSVLRKAELSYETSGELFSLSMRLADGRARAE